MIKYVQKKDIDFNLMKIYLQDTIISNQFTNNGPVKSLLESRLENVLEIDSDKRVLCVSNGTHALHSIYFYLLRRNPDIRIVSPSFTFPSCDVGFNNVDLIDISLDTYTLPLNEENLNKYDVFVITNLFGTYPNNISEWISRVRSKGKVLIFDNASSPMSKFKGINISNLGDFSFGSLHHTKYMGFGEGGFLVVPKELYEEFTEIIGFGFKSNVINRVHNKNSSNFKMSDVSAGSILQHLERYDFNAHLEIQKYFLDSIENIKDLVTPFNFQDGTFYGNMPVLFKRTIGKDAFRSKGIEAHKYYYPLNQDINSMNLFERIINFPLHSCLDKIQVDFMIASIKSVINE